ncbi:MAG: sigma-70 family RNA polymerase sigma factor [Acetivibrionales bacterium]|jgi:RNA polymerase primary sigma factor
MSNEELVKQIRQGINETNNMEQLYNQNRGVIYKLAQKYAFNNDDIEDLLQEAYFGLYEAVKRYEGTAGVLFIYYASYWIRQAVIRYLEDNGRMVRISNDMHYKILRYKKVVSAYEMHLGRKPLDNELRVHLKVSQQVLEGVKKAYHEFYNMRSLDELVPGTDGDCLFGDTVADLGVDVENSVVDRMIEENKRKELWQIVEDNVTPEQNAVITARYRNNMTLKDAGQIIGKTAERARVLQGEALRKLRHLRIRRKLEESFDINYARAHNGSLTGFRNRWSSIVEDIAIKNAEAERRYRQRMLNGS